ncbi:tripartite tricarboxylate transporter TctB family protein [Halalkalibacter alkaliphilus]|uniref:Tripartite tricarboxylate transporter TctB family protein n=1 Tax=Halalkalibacter alkaliphilus TaxID=2917993 RepID=A0A9X2CTD4_9BACI|nr:tripartite tricarboxylate transporter TctB family protein [Halalkalibacter alkaliphilus]MCL7747971.1 tripartite tricarboxylate transporter TctB family protein [Halalkalibacter alkaliphilus]
MGELLIGIALIVLCIIIYSQSGDFPQFNETTLNPGSFPQLIAILLGLLSLILVISKIKDLISQKAELSKMNVREYLKEVLVEYKLVFITLISLFLYIFLMQFIGFIVTTIIFIIVTSLIIGPKKKKDIIVATIVSVVITVTTYVFFENVLHVRFPSGLFF